MQTLNLTKKYEKYSEYKDSGIEWFGKIPKNWIFGKNNHGVSRHGKIFNSSESTPVLSLTKKGVKIKKDLSFGKSTESYIGHQLVQIGDIVFTPRDFDQTPILSGVAKDYGCISNLYFVVRPNNNMFAEFVNYYWWGLKYEYDYFTKFSSGMRSSFNYTQFKEIPLLIPSINEQKKIVKFLDEKTEMLDQIIEKKQKQIELLREKRIAVINNEIINKTKEKWKIEKIKHLVKSIESGVWGDEPVENENNIKCLRVADFDYENLSFSEVETIRNNPDLSKKKILQQGDILIEKSGGGEKTPVGRAILFNSNEKMVCANFIDIVRVNKEKVLPEFLVFFLSVLYSARVNTKYIKQNTGIQNMGIKAYFNEIIPFPEIKIQKEIVESIHKKMNFFDLALIKVEKSIRTLKEFKFSLISNVVTGKIKIIS